MPACLAERASRKRAFMLSPLAAAIAMSVAGTAGAFELDTGNPDLAIRWDNTVRYNVGVRTRDAGTVGNNPQFDEVEYRFPNRGDVVTNRVDLLTEADLVYQSRHGARISAAGWYDDAYSDGMAHRNPALLSVPGSYVNDQYTDYTKRYYRGPSGELLDAFVFTGFDLGDVPVSLKLGRHTVYWGESLFSFVHGVSYAQAPVDIGKATATPGTEAKELFRPLNQLSLSSQVTNDLTVAGQYFLDWESARFTEGGTFLGSADFVFNGPQQVFAGALFRNGGVATPDKRGDFGLAARWSPAWLDGTAGAYYRNFTDKLPAVLRTGTVYKQYYGENIDLFGLSLTKQVAGISVGSEISYRWNMPLLSSTLGSTAGAQLIDNSYQARGNTWHALINAIGSISRTPLWDSATYTGELVFSRWDKVTKNAQMFFGEGSSFICNGRALNASTGTVQNASVGCATKDYVGLNLGFTPTWLQVLPGVDLSMPLSYSRGLSGNAAVTLGGNEGNGSYSIGLGADVYSKYRFDLRFVDYFGDAVLRPQPLMPGAMQVVAVNGASTALKDRSSVTLTFKTTF